VRAHIEGGGALAMVGGDLSFASGLYGDSALHDVLPVELWGISAATDGRARVAGASFAEEQRRKTGPGVGSIRCRQGAQSGAAHRFGVDVGISSGGCGRRRPRVPALLGRSDSLAGARPRAHATSPATPMTKVDRKLE
jgi:hypothetical protein